VVRRALAPAHRAQERVAGRVESSLFSAVKRKLKLPRSDPQKRFFASLELREILRVWLVRGSRAAPGPASRR
jgi:hypothetical protein